MSGIRLVATVAITMAVLHAASWAKKPDIDDPNAAGALYGDLYVIERDGAGVPILRDVAYVDPETGDDVIASCEQPLRSDCALLPLWAECELATLADLPVGVLPLPLDAEGQISCEFDPELNDPCEVYAGVDPYDYPADLDEVSFGRGSVTRSPSFVVDSAYAEFLKGANEALDLHLDAARRLEMLIPSEEDPMVLTWKTIDAPLENLGLYRETMSYGCLPPVTEEIVGDEGTGLLRTHALDPSGIVLLRNRGLAHLVCLYPDEPSTWDADEQELACQVTDDPLGQEPDEPCWWEAPSVPDRTHEDYTVGEEVEGADMLSATGFLGAATDKSNALSLDEIIGINTYTGVNLFTWETIKNQRILTVRYFPFTDESGPSGWFGYTRAEQFPPGLTAELLVYDDSLLVFQSDAALALFDPDLSVYPYDYVDLDAVNLAICRQGVAAAEICDDAWYDEVWADGATGCGGANWFAQAAEHSRKTIWYLHNWAVPALDH